MVASSISALADRLAQMQLLSIVVLSGPGGEGFGSKSIVLLLPFLLLAAPAGFMADKWDRRRSQIALSLLRALLVLSVPTLLTYQLASTTTVTVCLFCLLSFVAVSIPSYLVSLQENSKNTIAVYAGAMLLDLLATIAAVFIFATLSNFSFPHETLRICAIFYLISMFIWWTTRARAPVQPGNVSFLGYIKMHKFAAPCLRLIFLCDALCGLLYINFYLFCLQNVQLANEDTGKIFLTIACGFLSGTLIAIWSKTPAKQMLKFFLLESLIIYAFFCAAGSHELLLAFSFLAGLSGACVFLHANAQAQKLVPRQLRGQVIGARISVTTAILLASSLSAEQLAIRYSGLTLMKILSIESAVLGILVFLFRNQVSRHLNKSPHLKIRVI